MQNKYFQWQFKEWINYREREEHVFKKEGYLPEEERKLLMTRQPIIQERLEGNYWAKRERKIQRKEMQMLLERAFM